MLLKKLSIPLIDFRLQTSENFKPLNSGVYQIQREKNEEKVVNSEVSKEEESEGEQYEMKAAKSDEKLVIDVSSDSEVSKEESDDKQYEMKEAKSDEKLVIDVSSDSEVLKEEESEDEQYEMKEAKSDKKPVIVVPSDSEVSKEEESEDGQYEMKAVKKPGESYQRRSSRQRKVVKSMKEENSEKSDESPSSEEDNKKEDPDFDSEEEHETIRKKKEMKRKSKGVTKFVKKEPLSAYELMIQKNREEKMAFLQSLQIDEVKTAFSETVRNATRKKVQPVKRKCVKAERPTILRKSKRLENVKGDLCEETLYKNALIKSAEYEKPKQVIPPEITFKEAFEKAEDFYESFKVDVAIQEESKPDVNFTIYDKTVLGKMTVSEQNVAKVTPAGIYALTWYPSPENLIIAAGDMQGQLGMWNIESGNPYVFKIHRAAISHLQFNPYNQTQLISSSWDGTLRCGDMVKHQFSEFYDIPDTWCTYFDVLSATTYLVGQRNGVVALVDKRTTSNESCWKKHVCHKYSIKTVNIHPTDKNFFLTAGNEGFRLWDLRKFQSTPVADITRSCINVHSAFFSPVTGNSILALSKDDSISMFDSKDLTSDFKLRAPVRRVKKRKWCINRATWLPNSDEMFAVRSMHHSRIEVYDKNLFVYHYMINENLTRIGTNAFHPTRPAIAGGNNSGKVFVFV